MGYPEERSQSIDLVTVNMNLMLTEPHTCRSDGVIHRLPQLFSCYFLATTAKDEAKQPKDLSECNQALSQRPHNVEFNVSN